MGQRYERSKKSVKESTQEKKRINTDVTTLKNEYASIYELNNMISDLDEEVTESIVKVENVGTSEELRLKDERVQADEESRQIEAEIDKEIEKLDNGLSKLKSLEKYNYGKNVLGQGVSEYQKQIEQYKALKTELLEVAKNGDVGAIDAIVTENRSLIDNLGDSANDVDGVNTNLDLATHTYQLVTQNEHRPLVSSRSEAVNSIIDDIMAGSGKNISIEQAEHYYQGVHDFSGEDYGLIRSAYNNPDADQEARARMEYLDEYIHNAPKWEGQVYRGINVSRKTANEILANNQVDMQGPSSWSSELDVAERFSVIGEENTHMIFVLPENKSGASITHIAAYNGIESEVTAPSGIQYNIDRYEYVKSGNRDYIYVYVHE